MIIILLLSLLVLVNLIIYFQTKPKLNLKEKQNTMAVSVRSCNCKHESQDGMYGKSQRLHNKCAKGHRCTVCGNVKGSTESAPKK
jgi:hypothetical protein